jgi:restriction system protein
VITSAGQLYRFRNEIEIGDQVITYDPKQRIYLVGEISGEYRFDPTVYEDDPNVRSAKWLREIDRDRLSPSARNSLGSTLTLFRISDEVRDEILNVLAGEKSSTYELIPEEAADETDLLADIQLRALEFIKDRITKLDWEEVQELIAGLLRAMGYKTQVSPAGADRGKDIIASPDGFGFEAPRIFVEVKHRNQQSGSQDIRSFLGGRHPQDRGLYVSTGGFSKDARYEAERANIPIQLMDLDLMVQAILSNYDKFDIESQRVLPLKRVFWPS